jgi:hypothetical protein
MTDIVIVIGWKRHDEAHWIRPSPPHTNTEQQWLVWFEGEQIGSWRYPEGAAARWLLANGKAERTDTLRTRQLVDGKEEPAMRGSVGWFADHTISESDKHGLRVVKYVPMPERLTAVRGNVAGRESGDTPGQG